MIQFFATREERKEHGYLSSRVDNQVIEMFADFFGDATRMLEDEALDVFASCVADERNHRTAPPKIPAGQRFWFVQDIPDEIAQTLFNMAHYCAKHGAWTRERFPSLVNAFLLALLMELSRRPGGSLQPFHGRRGNH